MKKAKLYLIIGIAAAVTILFPFVAPKFQIRMFTEIIILTLFAMTWKMMLNEGGMFSFGHAVYFGMGAYASVLGWLHIPGLSFLSGILLGALCAARGRFPSRRVPGADERDVFRPPHPGLQPAHMGDRLEMAGCDRRGRRAGEIPEARASSGSP